MKKDGSVFTLENEELLICAAAVGARHSVPVHTLSLIHI